MRTFVLVAAATLAATTSLSAQFRRNREAEPVRGVTFDVAAALDHRYRITVEPAVFGRVSVGITGSYTSTPEVNQYYYPYALAERRMAAFDLVPCNPYDYCPPGYDRNGKYRAWSFDLNARWYPAFLSVQRPQARVMAYVGEFIGYHRRESTQPQYINPPCQLCEFPQPADTTVGPLPPNPYPCGYAGCAQQPGAWQNLVEGFEPGVEIGIRAVALPFAFVDVGWSMRLVRLDDPTRTKRPGDVDGRLVVAAGIGW